MSPNYRPGQRVISFDGIHWGTVNGAWTTNGKPSVSVHWDSGENLTVEPEWITPAHESNKPDPKRITRTMLNGQDYCEIVAFLHNTATSAKNAKIRNWARMEFKTLYGFPVDRVDFSHLHNLLKQCDKFTGTEKVTVIT